MSGSLLANALDIRYGGVRALANVSLAVTPGTVVGLIGPNGAGKTTLLNALTGVAKLNGGTIFLGELELSRLPPYARARAGIARTYQNIRLFAELTIEQNIAAGAFAGGSAPSADAARLLMERVGMEPHKLDRIAGTLPYGEQRRLEIARSLAGAPQMLLLDEPAAGMNPSEARGLRGLIRSVASDGAGVLLIEHDMGLVSAVCDQVVVLNFGSEIARGTPAEIARDPGVIEAYLGSSGGVRS